MRTLDDDDDFGALLAAFEEERPEPQVGETVEGEVTVIGAEVVFVDLGSKADGTLERNQVTDAEGQLRVAVGDRIEAVVAALDPAGNYVLRIPGGPAAAEKSDLALAFQQKLPVEGFVDSHNKGGFEVMLGSLRAFCPISQIADHYVDDPTVHVGQRYAFLIQSFEEHGQRLNLVVSRRRLLEQEAQQRIEALRKTLSEGAVVEGTVSSITSYGAFLDLGGLEGLLHVSEMSYRRGVDPHQMVREGQTLQVKILRFEPPKKPGQNERIALSLRALERDPWTELDKRFPKDTVVQGTVMRLEPFGAFVEVTPGVEGLVHISRLGGAGNERHARDIVALGQTIKVRVLDVDTEARRVGLAREAEGPSDEERRDLEEHLGDRQNTPQLGSLGDFFRRGQHDD